MDASVAVITANYGAFDELRPQVAQDIEVDWLCFSDRELGGPEPWTVRVDQRDGHSCLAAKRFKMLPSGAYRKVVWVDANMEVTNPAFVREALDCVHDGLAVWAHPRRDCIYDEAEASVGAEAQGGKYDGQPLREQVDSYRQEGHPPHAGLYACGTVAWDWADQSAWHVGSAWLNECNKWSWQDQLSLPVVLRRLGVVPGVFPVRQIEGRQQDSLTNRWLTIHPHLR